MLAHAAALLLPLISSHGDGVTAANGGSCSGACECCIGDYCSPVVVGDATSTDDCAELYPDCETCADQSPGQCDWAGCPPTCALGDVGCAGDTPSCTCLYGPSACDADTSSCSLSPNINVSPGITVPLGLIFLPIGLAIALAGYRLWKYVVFMLGFLIMGILCALVAFVDAAANGDADPDAAMILAFLIGGVCGGFCFIVMYFVVVFCSGCGCGMMTVSLLATLFMGSNISADNVQLIGIFALIGGLIMGVVFIAYQKVCIMLGTAYFGSELIWSSIFFGLFQTFDEPTIMGLLTIASTGAAFYVQWTYTGKGVEINPSTGQVTVVVVPGQPAFLQRLDQLAGLQPAQPAAPTMTAGVQWQQATTAAQAQSVQPAWTQPPLQQQQQQPGVHAPLLQATVNNAPTLSPTAAATAAAAAAAAQSPQSSADPTTLTLTEFCTINKFSAFEAAIADFGVAVPSELEDVTDAQLTAVGFNTIQLKRLRKQIPAATAAAATPLPSNPPMQQQVTTANVAALSPPAAVDESVDVAASASAGSTGSTSTIGGSE
jgi:hypothetical protein